jgi:transcriptional regulator with XRE-family HTH domain
MIGDILKQLRLEKGWTQEQLSEKSGVSQAHYSYIEIHRMPRFDVACKLCHALGITPTELAERAGLGVATRAKVQRSS